MAQCNTPRVLSIQSHVVHGYVGNKCAVLSLNRLGIDVDAVHSVHFSNHTGYPTFTGQVLDGPQLLQIMDGLESNGLLSQYSHIMTGYIGSLSLLETIVEVHARLHKANPDIIYVCDPVQGDDGRLYCKQELPEAFRTQILPIASVITPNQFEAELLTGTSISSEQDAIKVCELLHNKGPSIVVITSMRTVDDSKITIVGSSRTTREKWKLTVPRVDAYFTGTGDLFTSLLLAWLHRYPDNLKMALESAVAGLQAVLLDTVKYANEKAKGLEIDPTIRNAQVCAARELRLVQNQDALVHPNTEAYQAIPLHQDLE